MNKLSSKIFTLIPAIVCFSNSYLYSFESHNELEISSNLKLHIDFSGEAILGGKINVKLSALSDELKKLENININLLINRGIFRFIKKYFDYSDIFKIKTEKLENNMLRVEFTLKNKKEFSFSSSSEIELMNFDLNIKKKIEQNESDVIFKFDIENVEKDFYQHISMSPKITNIEIENQNINFNENTKSYKLVVPYEEKYLDLKISKILDGNEESEFKHVKLKKAGSYTYIKVEDYEIEVERLEKEKIKTPKKEKLQNIVSENTSIKKKANKENQKSIDKNENCQSSKKSNSKNKKVKSKKEKIQEICEEDLEQDDKEYIEDNIEKENHENLKEEKIENNQNNDKIKWILGCAAISLFLIILFAKLKNKHKGKK